MLCSAVVCRFHCSRGSASSEPVEPELRHSNAVRSFNRYIEEGSPHIALQYLDFHSRNRELFSTRELDDFRQIAHRELIADFEQAVAEENFIAAIRLYKSIESIELLDAIDGWSLNGLYLSLAEKLRADGNDVLALYTVLQVPLLPELEEQELNRYAGIALATNNNYALRSIVNTLEQRQLGVDEGYRARLIEGLNIENLLAGAATVWVDRGIKFEGGVGVPDRVIGSAFYIDKRGYMITNYHVIASEVDPTYEGYSRLFIRPADNPEQRIPARVVGYDRIFDVALIKVEVTAPYVFAFNNLREISLGTRIFALGSPGGLENTITSGIVSATKRRFLQIGDALQVDVPVNPGNSGGPLISESGDLIGIIFAGIEQFEGVNFAIPSYWIQRFLPQLYESGEVRHAWLGVGIHELPDSIEVFYVTPGSPAEMAGIAKGDIIRSIDGWHPTDLDNAQDILLSLMPESLITIEWERDGTVISGLVALEERPFSPLAETADRQAIDRLFAPLFGFDADEIRALPWYREYVIRRIYPGTIAAETGLSVEDPFTLFGWAVDLENRLVFMQMSVRRRTAGFSESGIQLAASLEQNSFL